MSPSRRTLLRTCGVALSAAAGGCLTSSPGSSTSDPESTDETATPRATETTETTEATTDDETTTTATFPPEVREVDGVGRSVPSALTGLENADPFLLLAVGSRERVSNPDDNRPHVLAVWNATDELSTVELALTADGETILDDQFEFESGASLAMELREPGRYELAVRAGDREEVAAVERGRFDCNDSATDVAIRDDEIESGWIATEMACSTTTV